MATAFGRFLTIFCEICGLISWMASGEPIPLSAHRARSGKKRVRKRRFSVDHGYPPAAARRYGTPVLILISAIGANESSLFFYNRVKGRGKREPGGTGFESLTFARPGLIGGKRHESSPFGPVRGLVRQAFHSVLPRSWRINPAGRSVAALPMPPYGPNRVSRWRFRKKWSETKRFSVFCALVPEKPVSRFNEALSVRGYPLRTVRSERTGPLHRRLPPLSR